MSKLLIAVDLAKDVFELAVATPSGHITERKRLTRLQFERFWASRTPCQVVMEACGSAHHWARYLLGLGFEVTLLPAKYVGPYRQRNKSDRIDCEALLEAFRSPRIKPVAVKTLSNQLRIRTPLTIAHRTTLRLSGRAHHLWWGNEAAQ